MKWTIVFLMTVFTFKAFAHGETQLGPNKGFIRMPGTFHTELVPDTDGNFLVYLLDVNNQNPAVKDSSVEFKVVDKTGSVTFKCLSMPDHFHCVNEKKITNMKNAKIVLKTKRLGVKGTEAVYELPLALQPQQVDHSQMKH